MSSNLPSEQLHCLFLFVSLVVVQFYEELGKFRELNPASPFHVHLVDHVLHLVVCGVLAQRSQHRYQLLHMRVLALKTSEQVSQALCTNRVINAPGVVLVKLQESLFCYKRHSRI